MQFLEYTGSADGFMGPCNEPAAHRTAALKEPPLLSPPASSRPALLQLSCAHQSSEDS